MHHKGHWGPVTLHAVNKQDHAIAPPCWVPGGMHAALSSWYSQEH